MTDEHDNKIRFLEPDKHDNFLFYSWWSLSISAGESLNNNNPS